MTNDQDVVKMPRQQDDDVEPGDEDTTKKQDKAVMENKRRW